MHSHAFFDPLLNNSSICAKAVDSTDGLSFGLSIEATRILGVREFLDDGLVWIESVSTVGVVVGISIKEGVFVTRSGVRTGSPPLNLTDADG